RQLAAALVLRFEAVDVALVLAHQVAARRPDRQAEFEGARAAGLGGQLHLDAARLGLDDAEGVRGGHAGRGVYRESIRLIWSASGASGARSRYFLYSTLASAFLPCRT